MSVVSPDAAPIKRLVQDTRTTGRLIDATGGKKTRSVIVCDSTHLVLSALTPETVQGRINGVFSESGDTESEND